MAIADHTPAARQAGSAQDGARAGASAVRYAWALARLSLGFVFVWAFVVKLFGLGHDMTTKQAWIHGGHPALGFLKFAAAGPFTGFYHSPGPPGPTGCSCSAWLASSRHCCLAWA
jgi:thiosulfate dehydrogenase [quinone] large subunit